MRSKINVRNWLIENGFDRFIDIFEDNEIDGDLLNELTREDLRDLGLPLGIQKRMLKLIEKLEQPISADNSRASSADTGIAERRQLTVMFCDLVGSTAMSSAMDEEDFADVIVAYQSACDGPIKRYEGYIARYFGDGILIYFGYPRANENDSERAVLTALNIIEEVKKLSIKIKREKNVELAVRIGIATGSAVVGDLIGEGVSQESVALGDTPNLAAHLQKLAKPNEMVLSSTTRRLIRDHFEFRDLGKFEIKGLSKPMTAWTVDSQKPHHSGLSVLNPGQPKHSPLVGRQEEFDILKRRWQHSQQQEGQVVLISGEAGIGKSRIIDALKHHIGPDECVLLPYQCSPYHTGSALHPVIEHIKLAAKITRDDSSAVMLEKIQSLVFQTQPNNIKTVSLFASLLSIPTGDRLPPLQLTPQQQKHATFDALAELLLALSKKAPVLVLFEDVHWADPSSIELIELMISLIQDYRILLVVTHRPEFQSNWSGESNTTLLNLGKLRATNTLELIGSLTNGKQLPSDVTELITEKTDGIPLFVEELTRSLLESGQLIEHDNHFTLDVPLPRIAIPDTLQDSLMARLDRLADVKEIAQTAAVIGRDFPFELLKAVTIRSSENLESALERLRSAGMVLRRGTSVDIRYTFKHALIRDTAYQSLLKSRRQRIHLAIANAIAEQFPERLTLEPHLIAHHYTEGGDIETAVPFWTRAAHLAYSQFANLESIDHSNSGLHLLRNMPQTAQNKGQELALQFLNGAAYRVTQGYASVVAENAFRKAMKLAKELNHIDHYADANRGLFAAYYVSGRLRESLTLGDELLELAQTPMQKMQAQYMRGSIFFWFGELEKAQNTLQASLELYDDKALSGLSLQLDPGVMATIYLGLTLAYQGYSEQAMKLGNEAVEKAQALQQPLLLGQALLLSATICYHCEHDYMPVIERMVQHSKEHKIPFLDAICDCFLGLHKIQNDEPATGLPQCQKGFENYRTLSAYSGSTIILSFIAQGCILLERFDEALDWLQQGFTVAEKSQELINDAELFLLQGQTLLKKQQQSEAEDAFKMGLDVAEKHGSQRLKLCNATCLAQLWVEQQKHAEALQLLKPIYDSLSEGLAAESSRRAKTLIDSLKVS